MTTLIVVHRAQTFKSWGSGVFLFSSTNTNPNSSLQKIKYRNLMVILTMFSSSGCLRLYSFETVDAEQEKAQEGESIRHIQQFTSGQL